MTAPTTNNTKPKADIRPSAPGTVDAWLDVLVSMLALPKPDRERVRDELEDHLRSRIDDLLITGHTEPEALKQAVGELGETADLARQLTHAHNDPTRTRKHIMHAILFAIVGSTLTLGALNMRPANAVLVPHAESASAAAVADPHERFGDVNLRDTTLQAVIKTITAGADRPVLVHWDVLGERGIDHDTPINFDTDPLPHHHVHGLLIEHFARELGDDTLDVYESDDLFEISTRSHFDARSTERKTYDLSEFVSSNSGRSGGQRGSDARDAFFDVQKAILGHVEPSAWGQNGGDRAAMSLVGASLVVTAPERLHDEIGRLLNELRAERREREAIERDAAARRADQLRAEYDSLVEKRFSVHERMSRFKNRAQSIRERLAVGGMDNAERQTLMDEIPGLESMLDRVRFEYEDIEKRVEYLRSRLIDAEYASIS